MSRRHVGASFEVPAMIVPASPAFRERFVNPMLSAVRDAVGGPAGKKFLDLELPNAATHAEIIRDFEGLPSARLITAYGLHNFGTPDAPEYRFAHIGRVDVLFEEVPEACIGKDPACPCQDGDMCHYRGPNAWPVPEIQDGHVRG